VRNVGLGHGSTFSQNSCRRHVDFLVIDCLFVTYAFRVATRTGNTRLISHACAGIAAKRFFNLSIAFAVQMSAFGDRGRSHIDWPLAFESVRFLSLSKTGGVSRTIPLIVYCALSCGRDSSSTGIHPLTLLYRFIENYERSTNMIVKVKGGYKVVSEKGKKNLGGPYKSKAAAEKRLRQVEFFKHRKS